MDEISGDKLRGHLESLILSTLQRGEAHGLEILRKTRDDEDSYTISPVITAIMTASVITELQQQFEQLLNGDTPQDPQDDDD